jgi:hypothetical protein
MYANLYMYAVGIGKLHLHPDARLADIRQGLMEVADDGTFDGILTLQEFACAQRDAGALRKAQAMWSAYATQPQVKGPQAQLDARCRSWESSLPPAAATSPAAPTQHGTEATDSVSVSGVPGANLLYPAAPPEIAQTLYQVSLGTWERLTTPAGEVFTCKDCEYPVQVLVTVGPVLPADASFGTNEGFLALLGSPESRLRAARMHTEQAGQLVGAGISYELNVEKAELAEFDGQRAFCYESVLHLGRHATRETAIELVHKGRMLRVAIDRGDGPQGRRELEVVPAFIKGITLQR